MRGLLLALLLPLAACPSGSKPTAEKADENKNPYKNVTPQKVKEQVEQIQQQEEDRTDKKLEEAK